jgi:hypothetical protein
MIFEAIFEAFGDGELETINGCPHGFNMIQMPVQYTSVCNPSKSRVRLPKLLIQKLISI